MPRCQVGRLRLWLLRALYLFIAVGLALSTWQELLNGIGHAADSHTVVNAFLLSIMMLASFGVMHPLKYLPLLLFELGWKLLWLLLFAVPMAVKDNLDDYGRSVMFACLMGVILTLLIIPWRYTLRYYFCWNSSQGNAAPLSPSD